jgi:hypothetical protein
MEFTRQKPDPENFTRQLRLGRKAKSKKHGAKCEVKRNLRHEVSPVFLSVIMAPCPFGPILFPRGRDDINNDPGRG